MYSHTHEHRVCMHEAVLFTAQFATRDSREPLLRASCPRRDVLAPGPSDMTLVIFESLLASGTMRCPKLTLHISCLVSPISLFLVGSGLLY